MEKKIIDILKQILEIDSVDKSCSQENCDSWDSMAQLNIVIEIEAEFGISLEPEDIVEMKNVENIVNIVNSKF